MEAVILAGGMGTRLRAVVGETPKPMAAIGGEPFLKYLLKWLDNQGVSRAVLSTGYMAEKIRAGFGGRYGGLAIDYCEEETSLGTGGAIRESLKLCGGGGVCVINGDTLFDVNLRDMLKFHEESRADVTVALKEMENFDRYGAVETSGAGGGEITAFHEKIFTARGLINGGVYILGKEVFSGYDLPERFSFEVDFLAAYIGKLKIAGFISNGGFIDIGVPEDYEAAQSLVPKWVSL